MVEITILTTILAKFEDGTKKLVHYDPVEKQIYAQDAISDEQADAIKSLFSEQFGIVTESEDHPDLNVDVDSIVGPYRDQPWEDETESTEDTNT